ncbi:MAG: hypothetical protein LBS63_00165, partial [Prevotellaceae bacterium]|nr:hypothetical protein [Prevotellaceae bacterium]
MELEIKHYLCSVVRNSLWLKNKKTCAMKRILIVLLGGLVLVSSCGRANRKAEEKQANVERIRVRQDSIRQVDATRMLELRLQARQ